MMEDLGLYTQKVQIIPSQVEQVNLAEERSVPLEFMMPPAAKV